MNPRGLLEKVRRELSGLNQEIVNNRFVLDALDGRLSLDRIRLFVENQYYIVYHDARSLALMAKNSRTQEEAEYFSKLAMGDLKAFKDLVRLGEELGVGLREFSKLRIIPGSVAYTHYMAWLAMYGNPGEQALALVVNLPVWGEACSKLGRALREKYGVSNTSFLEFFASTPGWVEEEGLAIMGRYMDGSEERYRLVARMIQAYEAGFWEGVYSGG